MHHTTMCCTLEDVWEEVWGSMQCDPLFHIQQAPGRRLALRGIGTCMCCTLPRPVCFTCAVCACSRKSTPTASTPHVLHRTAPCRAGCVRHAWLRLPHRAAL
eukprot:353468-Chlamydomonas_euryale.AAC.3